MPDPIKEQTKAWLSEQQRENEHLDYHRRQFADPYISTIHLRKLVGETLGFRVNAPFAAIDVGCGAGANIYHISEVLPNTNWTGLDIASHLFPIGDSLIAEKGGMRNPPRWISGDFYKIDKLLPRESFDLAFSIQTISWLPEYEEFLKHFLAMLRPGGIAFLTSLFTDFLVDANILITQYSTNFQPDGPYNYNVYCWERFRSVCFDLGAKGVEVQDFEIDRELPVPEHRRMGTFTRRAADEQLLQFSGPLLMPWKFVTIFM